MLDLDELRFRGIGRFVDWQVIKFSELGNLIQIDGQNTNTGGSSGSGKSTVFNALDYLLGLNDIPASVLQSRFTDQILEVEGYFKSDGKKVVIKRGKKLSVEANGEVITGSAKLAEEAIDKILAMPRALFKKILHKRQKEGGFFLNFTPKETHEFLTSCLNLNGEKGKLDKIENKVKELTNTQATHASLHEAQKLGLKATQDAILSLGLAPIRDMHREVVEGLKNKMDASETVLNGIRANHMSEVLDLEKNKPEIYNLSFDRSILDGIEEKISNINKEMTRLLNEEKERQSKVKREVSELKVQKSTLEYAIQTGNRLAQEAVGIAAEIKKIRSSVCPTCEQTWNTGASKEAELMKKLLASRDAIETGKRAQAALVELDAKIESFTLTLAPISPKELPELNEQLATLSEQRLAEKQRQDAHTTSENARNKALLDEYTTKQKSLQTKQNAESEQARGQYDVDRRAHDSAIAKLRAYNDAMERYENSQSRLKLQENEYCKAVDALSTELAKLEKELILAEESKRAVKSFISRSFDDALETIGDTATRIIRNIPNMANATIQLEGVKETQAGKIKEEVNAVLSMDGETGIPIKSLSGGERSSVDLAIDLSVIDLIESKTGKGINIFILDEPFNGLDTVSIEMALEVLKNSNINKRLVIVDHNPEVKQMVQDRIVIFRDGTTSRIL